MKNRVFTQNRIVFISVAILLTTVVQNLSYGQGSAKIYWTESGQIKRANLDGTAVENVIINLKSPIDVVLDLRNTKMYWVDYGAVKIQRANLDGTNIEDIITGFRAPPGPGVNVRCENGKCEGKLVPREGDPIVVPHELLNDPTCIAIDTDIDMIYWGNRRFSGRIRRADIDGTNIEGINRRPLNDAVNIKLDVKSGKMYWSDRFHDQILRMNLDGTHVERLVPEMLEPYGLALDLHARKMYWSVTIEGKIRRSDLNGNKSESLVTGLSYPMDIALDRRSRKIYWVSWDRETRRSKVQRANLDGSNITDVLTGLNYVAGMALDTEGVYDVAPDTNKLTTTWANVKSQ